MTKQTDDLNNITPSHDALHDKALVTDATTREAMLTDFHDNTSKATSALIKLKDSVIKGGLKVSCGKDTSKAIRKAKLAIGVNYATKKLKAIYATEIPNDKKNIAENALSKIKEKGIQLPEFLHRYLKIIMRWARWGRASWTEMGWCAGVGVD